MSPTPTPTPSSCSLAAIGSDTFESAGLFGANQVGVSWAGSPGASSYILERSLDNSTWSAIATGLSGTSFTDPQGLKYSTIYYYRVMAVSSAGTSAASQAVGAVTSALPDNLVGQAVSTTVVRRKPFTALWLQQLHGCPYRYVFSNQLHCHDQLGRWTFQPRHHQRQ